MLDGFVEGHERPIEPDPCLLLAFTACRLIQATRGISPFLPVVPMLHLVSGSGAPCQFDSMFKGTARTFDHSFPSLDSSALSQSSWCLRGLLIQTAFYPIDCPVILVPAGLAGKPVQKVKGLEMAGAGLLPRQGSITSTASPRYPPSPSASPPSDGPLLATSSPWESSRAGQHPEERLQHGRR